MYSVQSSRPPQKPARSRKVLAGIVVFVATVILAGVFWISSSSKGTITQVDANKQAATEAPFKQYQSKYITMTYKGMYKEKRRDTKQPGVEQTFLQASTSYEKTLSIAVQPLPQNGMASDSGFQYRQQHPELYRAQQLDIGGGQSTVWIKADGLEQTAFIPHGGQYAVVSFALARTNDSVGLPDEVTAALQSFAWK